MTAYNAYEFRGLNNFHVLLQEKEKERQKKILLRRYRIHESFGEAVKTSLNKVSLLRR